MFLLLPDERRKLE